MSWTRETLVGCHHVASLYELTGKKGKNPGPLMEESAQNQEWEAKHPKFSKNIHRKGKYISSLKMAEIKEEIARLNSLIKRSKNDQELIIRLKHTLDFGTCAYIFHW